MNTSRFTHHVAKKLGGTRELLARLDLDQVLIFSGVEQFRYRDDLPYPFRANSYFLEWADINLAGCFVCIRQDSERPELLLCEADDYWHTPEPPLSDELQASFDVRYFSEPAEAIKGILPDGRCAFVGPSPPAETKLPEHVAVNPEALLNGLDSLRTRKSDWELDNIRGANELAVRGHVRAEECFRNGESELEIHLAYLDAIGAMECELPYGNIIGLNTNAAVLHHWRLNRERPESPLSMLIDAGAAYRGYAADITRTYAYSEGLFADLICEMDSLQRSITATVAPGVSYSSLHETAFNEIGELLQRVGLINVNAEHSAYHELVSTFFPHGLGHFLGIQVHDRGGYEAESPESHPNLRLSCCLAAGNVVTVEPGMYLIPGLLQKLGASASRKHVNWELIDALLPYGGIRIEDNLIVTERGAENVTRDAFAEAKGSHRD